MKAIYFFVKANKTRFGSKIREVSEAVVLDISFTHTTVNDNNDVTNLLKSKLSELLISFFSTSKEIGEMILVLLLLLIIEFRK